MIKYVIGNTGLSNLSSSPRFRALAFVFFQAEDGIRNLVRSRGLGDVYKRQENVYIQSATLNGQAYSKTFIKHSDIVNGGTIQFQMDKKPNLNKGLATDCLLYTSDAADERSSVDLGGRRIIKKKKNKEQR